MPVLATTSAMAMGALGVTLSNLHLADLSAAGLLGTLVAAISGGVLAFLNRQKLSTIQINVNGRLTEALAENASLRAENKILKAKLRAKKAGQ